MWLSSLVAFNLGLISSLHCIAMCGGIITLLMRQAADEQSSKKQLLGFSLLYNLGRISSYTLAGIVAGVFGATFIQVFQDYKAHFYLQLIAALVLIMIALNILGIALFTRRLESVGQLLWSKLQLLGRKLAPLNSPLKIFSFGMVWGWLPCGLVYSALLYSMTTADPTHAAVAMLCFGLGTLPSMLSAGYLFEYLQQLSSKKQLRVLSALLLIVIAISLPVSSWYFSNHHDHGSHQQEHSHSHHH